MATFRKRLSKWEARVRRYSNKTISKNINKIAEDKKQTEDIASILKLSPSRRNQKYFKKSLVSK